MGVFFYVLKKMMDDLTDEQVLVLNDMVDRRMENTGEDRRTAALEVNKYLIRHLAAMKGIDLDQYR